MPIDIPAVPTRTALAALTPATDYAAYLTETYSPTAGGRAGIFYWTPGDFSAEVSADTLQGIFVQSNSVSASSGAWVRGHDRRSVQAEWWGARFNYEPNVGSPVDVSAAINAACDYVHSPSSFSAYQMGGEVIIPRGFGWFDQEIWVKDGVYLTGPGTLAGGLMFGGGNNVANAIYVGRKDGLAAFSCGLRNMQVRNLQDPVNTSANLKVIYTSTAQHTGGIEKIYIIAGARVGFHCEVGSGGATTILFRDVEIVSLSGTEGAHDTPCAILDYPASFIEATNILVQGPTDLIVPRGLIVKSGYVHLRGFHCETVENGLVIEQGSVPWHVTVRGATGGPDVTNVVMSTSSDRAGVHVELAQVLLNGATAAYKDNRTGGSTISADIFQPQFY